MSSAAVSISKFTLRMPAVWDSCEFIGTGVLRSDHRLCRAPIGGAWVDSREVRSRHPLNIRVRCRCRCTPLPVGCTEKAGLHWLPSLSPYVRSTFRAPRPICGKHRSAKIPDFVGAGCPFPPPDAGTNLVLLLGDLKAACSVPRATRVFMPTRSRPSVRARCCLWSARGQSAVEQGVGWLPDGGSGWVCWLPGRGALAFTGASIRR